MRENEQRRKREKNLTFKIAGIRLSFRIWQSRWRGRTSGRESLRRGEDQEGGVQVVTCKFEP